MKAWKLAVTAIAVALSGLSGAANARDLTVVGWGGSTQGAQKTLLFGPFSQSSGIKVLEDTWSGGIGILRTKVRGGNANWDVVQVEVDELALGCAEGLYEKLDWTKLGGRDKFLPVTASDCGIGATVWSTALLYDGDRLKDGPKSWVDFWDVKTFPGKRGLRKGAKYTLEFALMADGVPPSEVYKVLRTPNGVNRAFKKLDELKPNIVWWTAGSQPIQLLASGEVAMSVGYTSRANFTNNAEKRNYKIVWNGSMYAVDSWVILKGSPNKDSAMQLLAFWARPEVEKTYPNYGFSGVGNLEAIKQIDPKVAPLLATYPANLKDAITVDVEFWADNNDQLNQQFNAWAAK